jgi:hypothetical protein
VLVVLIDDTGFGASSAFGGPVNTPTAEHDPKTSAFSGRVRWVQIDLDVDDHDHLISPEERLRIAMARQ